MLTSRLMPNRLAGEKSPYLLQHQDNPVDWYPWGEEAFSRARAEGKPIFLSVGYSTCHWCHVMERESFENAAIAGLMNDKFVNVKVDREERPDVDRVYMAFVQATTGSGGWPMSVFLTPDLQPFYGGTYFPPDDRYGRPGFPALLRKIDELWHSRRPELEENGARILEEMRRSEAAGAPVLLDPAIATDAYRFFAQTFDREHAGFGRAPKFPRPVVHDFLLRHFARTGDADVANMVLATLHLMARGGMYDQLGGGFHRYSVDRYWHVPHFEKMLYDQAQLITSYLEGYQVAGDPFFARVARETCDYVLRDLTSPDGGFYSAEDADSLVPESASNPDPSSVPPVPAAKPRKAEGAFYVWTRAEIEAVLAPLEPSLGAGAAEIFCTFFAVETNGNAEDPHGELAGKNVLHAVTTAPALAQQSGRPEPEIERIVEACRRALFAARAARPRPHLDDKVLTSWNGLMISALARTAQVLSEPRYLEAATRAARFVLDKLWDPQAEGGAGRLYRRYRAGEVAFEAYLDDYANLISGLLDLYEASFDLSFLLLAEKLTDRQVALFHDAAEGGFFTTSGHDPSVLLRLKDDYDGAEPGANSVTAENLLRLAAMLGREDFARLADGTFRAFSNRLRQAPHALPRLVAVWDFARDAPAEVVIVGERDDPRTQALLASVRQPFAPRKTVLLADAATRASLGDRLPHIAAMGAADSTIPKVYLCKDHVCDRPVSDPTAVTDLLPHRGLS
jgi:uncharacterized protein